MKLDRSKSFGTVHGDNVIGFVQDGQHFTHAGDLVPDDAPASKVPVKPTVTDPLEAPKTFLSNVLKGGPIAKGLIYKEAENTNIVWADVNKARTEMGIKVYKQGTAEMWALAAE